MRQLTDQMEITRFFLEVADRVIEAQGEGATELTIPVPVESTDLAIRVAGLFNQTDVHAMVRGHVTLIVEWANRTFR